MSAETDLYAALSAHPDLAALVGGRIYPDAMPEGEALPAVVYQRSSTAPVTTISSVTVAEEVLFAISAWAETRESAEAVANYVAEAIAAAGDPYTDRTGGFDPECGLFVATIECDWWHVF